MADNASITILRNTQANINAEPIKDGNILFTTDQPSNEIYADVGAKRIKIGGGKGILNISKTGTSGLVDTYTITYNDGTTSTFDVTNGMNADGREVLRTLPNIGISGNTDINTSEYLNIGTYYCPIHVTAQTISNIPVKTAFFMYVIAPLGGTYGSESSAQWTYRLRIFITYHGDIYVQFVNSGQDPGVYEYGDWRRLISSDELNQNVAAMFDVIRPVGSLYSTTDANFNPNTAKGWHGVWERIKDCVIYASGDSDTVGQIVGNNTHTLTEAEMPSHRHSTPQLTATGGKHRHSRSTGSESYLYATTPSAGTAGGTAVSGGSGTVNWTSSGYTDYADNLSVTVPASNTGYTGSGTAIDIRPRRLNSVVWKRVS